MIRSFAQPKEQSPKRTFIYTRASTTPCLLLVLAVIRRHLSPLTAVRNNQNHFSLISECLCGNRWLKWRPGKCANAWHHTLYRSATVAQDRIGSPVKGANGSWRLSPPAAVLLPTTASSASRIPQGANCADHGRSLGHRNTINIRARTVSPFFFLFVFKGHCVCCVKSIGFDAGSVCCFSFFLSYGSGAKADAELPNLCSY